MLNFKCMGRIFKHSIASLLTISLAVTTVVCCCVGPAVMAHFHKTSVCSHCPTQKSSHDHSSNPGNNCMYQLTSADTFHGKIISAPTSVVFTSVFFDHHIPTPFLASSLSAYPRGSPPLNVNFTPIYLRTLSLRI